MEKKHNEIEENKIKMQYKKIYILFINNLIFIYRKLCYKIVK